jgi:RsiW-degrading membrane proteinase PrsW (M82 family)
MRQLPDVGTFKCMLLDLLLLSLLLVLVLVLVLLTLCQMAIIYRLRSLSLITRGNHHKL